MRNPRVRAPELTGRGWLNSGDKAVSLAGLRGKIVLLDFWTFGCINCLHVLDELRAIEEIRRDPRLQVVASKHASIFWIEFTEQWDAKSPWHDKRLRLAANLALDRKRINEAACLGFCPPAGVIVPRVMDFALQVEPPAYDLGRAKQLLAEAGYPKGFDAGDFATIPGFPTVAEAGFPGFQSTAWIGMVAPANTPKPVIGRISTELVRIIRSDEVRNRMRGIYFQAIGTTPEGLANLMREEVERWGRVIKRTGAKAD